MKHGSFHFAAALTLAAYLLSPWSAVAEEPEPAPPAPAPAVEETAPGVFQMGEITIDKNKNVVSFPVVFNMDDSIIEYLIVGENGKTHESLLRTKIQPNHIHMAMLLLGSKTARHTGTTEKDAAVEPPPSTINSDYLASAPALEGDPIIVTVEWKADGTSRKARAESFVIIHENDKALAQQLWTYNGSYFHRGRFLAQSYDTIAAVITDPVALINRSGTPGDIQYLVKPHSAPPVDTPAVVTLQLVPEKSSPSKPQQ